MTAEQLGEATGGIVMLIALLCAGILLGKKLISKINLKTKSTNSQ